MQQWNNAYASQISAKDSILIIINYYKWDPLKLTSRLDYIETNYRHFTKNEIAIVVNKLKINNKIINFSCAKSFYVYVHL